MNLEIEPGVIFGLVGPNGAGKTSTFKALTSLLNPTNGTITIQGKDIVKNRQLAQAQIGYMPDLAPVPSDLKLWEFLELFASSHGIKGSKKRERVRDCLEQVELSDKSNAYCKSLSRGMTQRLVLAKTLLHTPSLLILDEPASGMDVRSRVALRKTLKKATSEGATVLISSHILPELSEMCDQIGILHEGNLLDHGSTNKVLSRMTGLLPQMKITLAEPTTKSWETFLKEHPIVESYTIDPPVQTTIACNGTDLQLSTFIQQAIQKNHPICRASEHQKTLEDILMSL